MDSTKDTGEVDDFAALLAQLTAPTTEVVPAPAPAFPPVPAAPPAAAPAASAPQLAPSDPIAPSAPPGALDFAVLLAPSTDADRIPGSRAPLFGGGEEQPEDADIARSTVGERIALVLAILLPPIGLIVAIIGSIRSVNRRGWVVGVLRAALAIGIVLSVIVTIGGYLGYSVLRQQQLHDRTAASSAAFCSMIAADPTMIQAPDFGWPAVAATIPDSLAAMQAYEDKWTKLMKVSPAGIRPEVQKIATVAKQIIGSVTVARTVDDASNTSLMTAAAAASAVPAWDAEYCE